MSVRGFIGIADKYLPYYVTDEELFPGAAGGMAWYRKGNKTV